MWKELFINACILVTILFAASQIFKSSGLGPKAPVRVKTLLGALGGITACILIYFSIHVTSDVVLDFRHIVEILVASFGGLYPVALTGLITAAFRLLYKGVSNISILYSIGEMVVCIGLGLLYKLKLSQGVKAVVMLAYTLLVRSIIFFISLDDKYYALSVIISLCLSSIFVGIGVNYLVRYFVAAHKLFVRLERDSTQDFLTGLGNTRQFDIRYNEDLSSAIEHNEKVSLLMMDIDHFKKVNDTHGHIAGDEVLKQLGSLLIESGKAADLVSRIGGEEFAVVLKGLSTQETFETAEHIRKTIQSHNFTMPEGSRTKITVSIGAAVYPDTTEDIKNLKEAADTKLYEAKRTGRNRVCI